MSRACPLPELFYPYVQKLLYYKDQEQKLSSELVARVKNLIVELFTNTRIERTIYRDTCISLRFLHSFASFFREQNKNSAQFSHNFHTFVPTQTPTSEAFSHNKIKEESANISKWALADRRLRIEWQFELSLLFSLSRLCALRILICVINLIFCACWRPSCRLYFLIFSSFRLAQISSSHI